MSLINYMAEMINNVIYDKASMGGNDSRGALALYVDHTTMNELKNDAEALTYTVSDPMGRFPPKIEISGVPIYVAIQNYSWALVTIEKHGSFAPDNNLDRKLTNDIALQCMGKLR